MQQIINFEPQLVIVDDPLAYLPKANAYLENFGHSPDISMTAAIVQGLGGNRIQPISPVAFGCPSENCSWEPFRSLAVCSYCSDVSSHMNKIHIPALYISSEEFEGFERPFNITSFNLGGSSLTNIDAGNPYILPPKDQNEVQSLNLYVNGSYSVMDISSNQTPKTLSRSRNG